jgi:hypothetical protein
MRVRFRPIVEDSQSCHAVSAGKGRPKWLACNEGRNMSSMASVWMALLSMSAAPVPAVAVQAEAVSSSRCPPGAMLVSTAKRGNLPPPPGVELLSGVTTGMSREQVRRINPWLATNRPSRSVELVEGVKLRANVNFWGKPELSVSVEMNGNSKIDKVIVALSRRYGRPLMMRGPATVHLKWCDGSRRIVLVGERDHFWVSVAGRD